MNRQSLVAKMLHLQVVSALVCILLYFALLFATRAGLSYYNNQKTPGRLMSGWGSRAFC